MGYTRCPDPGYCNQSNTTGCACAVPDSYIEEFGAYNILSDAGIISYSDYLFGKSNHSDEYYLGLLSLFEDPGIVGEMLSSNAGNKIYCKLCG